MKRRVSRGSFAAAVHTRLAGAKRVEWCAIGAGLLYAPVVTAGGRQRKSVRYFAVRKHSAILSLINFLEPLANVGSARSRFSGLPRSAKAVRPLTVRVSAIGGLLPIALWGRTEHLYDVRRVREITGVMQGVQALLLCLPWRFR